MSCFLASRFTCHPWEIPSMKRSITKYLYFCLSFVRMSRSYKWKKLSLQGEPALPGFVYLSGFLTNLWFCAIRTFTIKASQLRDLLLAGWTRMAGNHLIMNTLSFVPITLVGTFRTTWLSITDRQVLYQRSHLDKTSRPSPPPVRPTTPSWFCRFEPMAYTLWILSYGFL